MVDKGSKVAGGSGEVAMGQKTVFWLRLAVKGVKVAVVAGSGGVANIPCIPPLYYINNPLKERRAT